MANRSSDRNTRPGGLRRDETRPTGLRYDETRRRPIAGENQEFDRLFRELLSVRGRYEQLRIAGGPLAERAVMLDRLHDVRARFAQLRLHDGLIS